jgi:hypothetical protein
MIRARAAPAAGRDAAIWSACLRLSSSAALVSDQRSPCHLVPGRTPLWRFLCQPMSGSAGHATPSSSQRTGRFTPRPRAALAEAGQPVLVWLGPELAPARCTSTSAPVAARSFGTLSATPPCGPTRIPTGTHAAVGEVFTSERGEQTSSEPLVCIPPSLVPGPRLSADISENRHPLFNRNHSHGRPQCPSRPVRDSRCRRLAFNSTVR